MESALARKLSTRAVAIGLLASLACLLTGTILLTVRGEEGPGFAATQLPRPGEIPAGLTTGEPLAWLTLGAVLLLLTPTLRVTGLALWCVAERRRGALVAGIGVLCFLLGALGRALYSLQVAA